MHAPHLKQVNGMALLNLIREHGPISRAGLARLSNLSKPTVSSLVEGLMRRRLVLEGGPGRAGERGGKIPTLLKFNAAAGLLVAVEVGSARIRVALTDLEGAILDRHEAPTGAADGAAAVLDRVEALVRELLARGRGRRSRLRLLALSTSGRVDVDRGLVIETGNVFNWSQVNVRERLHPVFRVPVTVDKDVNAAALGELHHGAASGESDFVLVRLGTGIGCGVVLGGRIYHGSRWAAGEIAHAVLAESAAGAECGPRGYLENVVGEDRVLAALHTESLDDLLSDIPLRERIANHLGLAVAMVSAIYDPPLIVLQGRLFQLLQSQICEIASRAIPWGVRLRLSTLEDDAVLLGTIVSARAQAYAECLHTVEA